VVALSRPNNPVPPSKENLTPLKLVYLNASSLASNLKRLAFEFEIVRQYDYPDIIVVTETWLDEHIPNSLFNCVASYNIFRSDRVGRNGGGVAIFVHKRLRSYELDISNLFENLEVCLIAVVSNRNKLFVGAVYKPSVSDVHLLKPLKSFFNYVSEKQGKHLIVGDFNLPDVDWGTLTAPNTGRQYDFIRAFGKFGFSQLVRQPTRGDNILDLILTDEPSIVCNVDVDIPFCSSDHNIVTARLTLHSECDPISRLAWHKGKFSELSDSLSTVDWRGLFQISDGVVDSMFDDFVNVCNSSIADFIPLIRPKNHKYKSRELRKALKDKSRAHKAYKLNRSVASLNYYKTASKAVDRVIYVEAERFEKSLLSNPNPKKFFNYVNSKLRTKVGYDAVSEGTRFINDDRKAELFNAQYSNVFTQDDGADLVLGMRPYAAELGDVSFTSEIVSNVIKHLPNKTSAGLDGLPAIFFKKCYASVVEPLRLLFETSFETSFVPQAWRDAVVIPVYKNKGNKSEVANYRPISLTPVVCRIMEAIIKSSILNHLARNRLISSSQHGFLTNRSTQTNLLSCLNNWVELLDQRSCVDVLYLDIAKAFDTVSHRKLLFKLGKYGISGRLLLWIKSFLSNRRQCVKINSTCSDFSVVGSGVPQGSVLGPVLFLLYINDLPDVLRDCSISIFADDSKIFFKADTGEDCAKIQSDINRVLSWCENWQLSVAAAKCNILHIGRANSKQMYTMGGNVIASISDMRDLGVLVSDDLKFSKHIGQICTAALQRVNLIFRAFTSRNTEMLVKTYIVYVRPLLEYNTCVWSPFLVSDIMRIEKVQRYFTRRLFVRENLTYEERLDLLGLESLELRRIVFDLLEVFKIVKGQSHIQFDDFFEYKLDRRTRGHRFQLRHRRAARLEVCKNWFAFRVVTLWNSLPETVVESPSLSVFRNKLKSCELHNHCHF